MTDAALLDLESIAAAAIAAVRPEDLVPRRLGCHGGRLLLDGGGFVEPASTGGRIAIVGGGKAAAGIAAALEAVLAPASVAGADIDGLVSVPEGCGRRLSRVEVRETRPAAANLPTTRVVAATREMQTLLAGLDAADLAIVIVTGGGSALLESPVAGVALEDVIAVTAGLSAAGADIRELNTVRQTLSAVKAGGLARGCGAGRLVAVVLSDVIGDPLDLIASGPCLPVHADPAAALAILRRHGMLAVSTAVTRHLERSADGAVATTSESALVGGEWQTQRGCRVSHVLLGTNATAVAAAARQARERGFDVTVREASPVVETADAVGRRLAAEGLKIAARVAGDGRPRAVIEGGEAVVAVPRDHGVGGRNQQTVLAAIAALHGGGDVWPAGLVVASVGTDGEDGPTRAAGGVATAAVVARLHEAAIDVPAAVARCDSFSALAAADGLLHTGPTGTNVADVRIMLARP
ncbi:MAG: DUF4147 domain-containing protein [Planctomycetaceae bacterium]